MQEQTEILKEMLGVLRETAATLRAGRDKSAESYADICDKLDSVIATMNVLCGGGSDTIGALAVRLDNIESTLSDIRAKLEEVHLSL